MKTAALAYSPYGYIANQTRLVSMLGFNGERYDPLNRLYALGKGYRRYNPALMRFVAPDSLSPFAEGGTNAYAYCAGDPINYVDPTGHIKGIANTLITNKALRHGKKQLRPVTTSIQTPKLPAKKRRVGKGVDVDVDVDVQSLEGFISSEMLQLSPPRPRTAKAKGVSILGNSVSPQNIYKDRQEYYLFVDKFLNTQAKLEQLLFDSPAPTTYKSQAKLELARIRDESNLLRATATRLYPYSHLPKFQRVV